MLKWRIVLALAAAFGSLASTRLDLAADSGGKSTTRPQKEGAAGCAKCHIPDGKGKWRSLSAYVGAGRCRDCHGGKDIGDAYGKWKASGHAKAFEALASDHAKELAKSCGVDDPQHDARCLRCHVTACSGPDKQLDKKFDRTLGVQCEDCHGAAGKHVKKRPPTSRPDTLPDPKVIATEIRKADVQTCLGCHNAESPAFKEFDVKERWAKIKHPDPRLKHGDGGDIQAVP